MTEIKIPVLDLKPQYEQIKDEVQAAINRVLESGQFIMGPDVKLFEQEVAEYWGVKQVIPSGIASLHAYLHPVALVI
jgi:dTDP-4-amino-4,6-dideoxygalactose transaminase